MFGSTLAKVRKLIAPATLACACALLAVSAAGREASAEQWIDLTHPFNAESVYWPTAKMFEKETVFAGHTEGGWYYSAFNFAAAEHGGTHTDAPIHFAEGALTLDRLPVAQLIGPGVVVDVRERAAKDADYLVTPADIEAHERVHGRIPEGAIVLIDTGRASLYPDRESYMGTAERGPEAVAKLHFPGLSKEAAELLVERRIGAVGIDTPSIDYGQSKTFAAHVALMSRNIPAFENVADMSALPPTGTTIVALPMKIEGGSGGPLRIVARLPGD
ncbi:MAG: cyclase family protein [Rhodospirillales bacterium]|nr:cyclase family protein [Rhodospirillales bacterium]